MAALALQFIEPDFYRALSTEPPEPPDEFITGHAVANIIVCARRSD